MFGSKFVDAIEEQSRKVPERTVFFNSAEEYLSYGELRERSNAVAVWLADEGNVAPGVPVILYGHKSPNMLVGIMACAKSGHAYVPVDTVYPADRVANIIEQVGETLVIDTSAGVIDWSEHLAEGGPAVIATDRLEQIYATVVSDEDVASLPGTAKDKTFYILFTSGSTGAPKGVEVTCECVDEFSRWMCEDYTFAEDGVRTWFNRTPYSFDVSITDMVCGTVRGDTTFALEAEADGSLAQTFAALARHTEITDWVSTPSFVEQCLAVAEFDASLLPNLRRMLLAGETLRSATVREVKRRFPQIHVYNGYGPTESTDLVTLCEITDELLADDLALPIGYPKKHSELVVLDPETLERVPDGQPGELFIVGETVARGYWGRPDLTEAAFHACPKEVCGERRSYRTGDEVHYGDNGMIYFHGRLDLQIKLHGYRIELGDIESCLCAVPLVHMACVLPVVRDGAIHHLCAVVVPSEQAELRGLKLTRQIKAAVRDVLPGYMIPTQFKYVDEIPLNTNGKADRKALSAIIEA